MSDLRVTRWGAIGFGRFWPCAIGKGGISGNKREGDGATPQGTLTITGCLFRPDRIPTPGPWAKAIGPKDLWCDDPTHPDYNLAVTQPFSASHEILRRSDPLYDLILITDHNWPIAKPGAGSAIFLHQWRHPRHPTEGCIAFSRKHIAQLAELLPPGSRIHIY